jgi:diguanylate cyclase (GGDEF)-like protein
MTIPSPALLSDPSDPKALRKLETVRYVCLLLVTVISGVILAAWLIPAVDGLFPGGWRLMKANTSLCALLCTIGLALNYRRPSRLVRYVSRASGFLVLVLTTAILYQYASGRSIGIDTLLAHDPSPSYPGRTSPQSAFSFFLIGVILLFVRTEKRRFSRAIDALALCLGMLVLVFGSGYYFGAMHLFGLSMQNRVGPQTLTCLFLLTVVVFNYRTQYGVFSVMRGDTIAGKTARLAAPVALVLPFILTIVRGFVVKLSVMQTEYASALATSCAAMTYFCLVLILSRRIGALENNIRDLSLRDELTRLYNRRGFYLLADQALRLAQRDAESFSVLFLDVDQLKFVNDNLGHEIGSELLKEVALILNTTIRASDVLGRLGGDEFVVAGKAGSDDIKLITERIAAATLQANARADRRYTVSFSFGYVTAEPGNHQSLDDLLGQADRIMYQAKREKRTSPAIRLIEDSLVPSS